LFGKRHRFFTKWDGPLTAVAAWRATADEKERALSPREARRILATFDRRASVSRALLLDLYQAALGTKPDARVDFVFAGVDGALRDKRLLFIGGWGLGAGGPALGTGAEEGGASDGDVIRQIMGKRSAIAFEGRDYRLVTADSRSEPGRGDSFGVVPLGEARGIVARMLERSARTASLAAAWEEIATRLIDVRGGDGFLLLRGRPSGGAASAQPAPAPPSTPSQAKTEIQPTDWIQVEVVYDDGTPYEGNCHVQLPDGRDTEGPLDGAGTIRIDGLDPGSCKVSFPDLNGAAAPASG